MFMKTAVKRAGIVAASAAVAIGFASSPAMASNVSISLPNGRGTMTFIDDGDKFRVCDTRVDDHGVTGYVRQLRADGRIVTILTIDDGGDNGCDTKETDLLGRTPHDMVLCWNGGGACVVSPVIRES
jgi:hypothetical protein